jgi:diacylglycerol kinase (ATP)
MPDPKRAAVIFNPTKVDIVALRLAVDSAVSATGWAECLWCETTVEDVGQKVTKEALDTGADLLIAAGGDGTVRAVAEALQSSQTPLALVPSGTGNLLARTLKFTLNDLPGSVEVAFVGTDKKVDLGIIDIERADRTRDRHAFLVMAGLGIDAKMIKNTDDDLKAKVGWAAYVRAIVASLRDPDELHFRYRLDQQELTRATVHTLIVGNCGALPGKIYLMPDAVLDDGLFDLMMTRPTGIIGWPNVWARVAWLNGVIRRTKAGKAVTGDHSNDARLHYRTGQRITVRLSRPEEIELDGDGFGKATAFDARISAGGLTIRVPDASV